MSRKKKGICKLTNTEGVYVKSHVIPKSITRPSVSGNKFIEKKKSLRGTYYGSASDSWYDQEIVTREGEDILADIDSYAIEELRSQGLVWSSKSHRGTSNDKGCDIAIIKFNKPERMRKYFLSLLWRAAITDIPAFDEVKLCDCHLERLRQILIGEIDDDRAFFPISLVQLATRGHAQNLAPIKEKIKFDGGKYIYIGFTTKV